MTQTLLKQSPANAAADEKRWAAVVARDKACDGEFYYSVATTGVYCRPSCAARLPNRRNVRFHSSPTDAEAQGFRPCKRCRPDELSIDQRHAQIVADACRRIESAEELPSLDALAAKSGLSKFHFHRVFKAIAGLTPKDYARAHRRTRVRRELARGATVTEAIYGAGFNSSTGFYTGATEALGMTPARFRSGGKQSVLRFAVGECSLGAILVAASEKGIAAILLGDNPNLLVREFQERFSQAELIGGDKEFEKIVAQVIAFAERPAAKFDLPLDIRGTIFQQRVWQALRAIPPGATATYTEIAGRIGMPRAVRAVARACATNMLAIAIPCHRVVRADGDLAGYRWGIDRKRALLLREAATPAAKRRRS
jgi:AraC family transcriptional regulator of adaptative response/methylated-DNA-[protein]-cysteine methyltransferase